MLSDEFTQELRIHSDFLENLRQDAGKKSPLSFNDILILHNNLEIEKRINLTMKPWMKKALDDERLEKLRKMYYKIYGHGELIKRFTSGCTN